MSKYNFKFGDVWLSEFGGVCTEVPPIEIASKDVTLIDIPNKDGSDCIDNGRYCNVEFTRTVALVGNRISTVQEKAKNLIKHFAYLQGYQKFEDTDHEGMVTQAVLLNLDEVTKNLRTMFTAVLKFSRKPYWKLKSSLSEEKLNSTLLAGKGVVLNNPFPSSACPIIRYYFATDPHSTMATTKVNFSFSSNGETITYSKPGINFKPTHNILDIDIEEQRAVVHSPGGEIYKYVDVPIPKPISKGTTIFKAVLSKETEKVSIFPNWRCLY